MRRKVSCATCCQNERVPNWASKSAATAVSGGGMAGDASVIDFGIQGGKAFFPDTIRMGAGLCYSEDLQVWFVSRVALVAHSRVGDGVGNVCKKKANEAEQAGDESSGEDEFGVFIEDGVDV